MEILKHNCITRAATYVRQGGVIVFPTDTVWGIGGNGLDPKVADRVRQLKGKPADAPLVWLLPTLTAVVKYCGPLDAVQRKLLLQKHTTVIVNGQAVRLARHGWLHRLVLQCGGPLIATSANHHGQPPVQSWRQAVNVFGEDVAAVIRGRRILKNLPSTVVEVQSGQIKVLRPGRGISIK